MPLVKGARITGEGHKAAARGEEEYQELINRFEGHVHLSRGRPAAANARLKLSSRPSHVPAPRGRSIPSVPQSTSSNPSVPGPQSSPSVPRSTSSSHRGATVPPPPRDDEFTFLSESEDSRAADEADGHGPGGQPDVTVRVEAKAPVIAVQVPRVRSAKEACGPGRKGTSGRSDKAPGDAGGPVGRVEEGEAPVARPPVECHGGQKNLKTGVQQSRKRRPTKSRKRRRKSKQESGLSASKAAGRGDAAAGGGTGGRVREALGKVVVPVVQKKTSCQSDGGAAKRQQPRKPQSATMTDPDPKGRKQGGGPSSWTKNRARVTRARLLDLAARYKTNHERVRAQQRQEEADGGGAVPEGEYEIEQILCSDSDGTLLVKWVGFGKPSWEPVAAIPAGARKAYGRQGHVKLVEYLALLEVAC